MTDIALRAMLASNVEWSRVRYPVAASPKIDGIRCVIVNGVAYGRSGKPLRNSYLQAEVARYARQLEGLDGELIAGKDPTAPGLLRHSSSAFNSIGGRVEFTYYVFDCILRPGDAWQARYDEIIMRMLPPWAQFVPHVTCLNEREVMRKEEQCVNEGYEGLMLRDPMGAYKQGRSTANEGLLLKVKRFKDAEADVIGFEEQMHNENAVVISPQGLTTRSSAQSGLVAAATLGALRCRLPDGTEFGIGTGFTAADRDQLWRDRESLIGQKVTFKSMPYGVHEAPRFPVFRALRSKEDM